MNTPVERLLANLPDAKPAGRGWSARCPAHEDRRASLSIAEGDDGGAVLHCHAGCEPAAVVAAIGLTLADLMPVNTVNVNGIRRTPKKTRVPLTPNHKPAGKIFPTAHDAVAEMERRHGPRSALWTYLDARGEPVGMVVRWDLTGGKKDILPVSRHGDRWIIGGMPEPRPLYGLPDLAGATRVCVCEGEKAAEAARSIGLIATTSAHGSQSPDKTDWTPLAGKQVVIFPDNDNAGEDYTDAVAALLAKLTPPPIVRLVELPGLPVGGDIVDWIEARGDAAEPDDLRRQVEALADAAEPIATQNVVPLRFKLFPTGALPGVVGQFVSEASAAIGCDPSFICLPLLACLARAIGDNRVIRLKKTWTEPAIVWAVIIAKSGGHKSPAIRAARGPLDRKQAEAISQHAVAMEEYERNHAEYERAYQAWKRSKSSEPPPWKPEEPVLYRYIVGDITIEALADRLAAHTGGVVVVRDELAGLVDGMAEYKGGKGSDTGHWLATWDASPLTVDRKTGTKKMIHIPRAVVSIVGGIQPGIFRRALGREHLQDGFCARLLLAMPPATRVRWSEATVNAATEEKLATIIDRLLSLEPAADAEGNPIPFAMPLTPDAKTEWVAFFDRHRDEQADLDDDLASAWSKLEAYTARLALIVQLCRWAEGAASDGVVDADSLRSAIRLVEWFANEAKRVYATFGETDDERDQRRLVEWIERRGGTVTARAVQQGCRWLKESGTAQAALDELVAAGSGRWESTPAGRRGQPTRQFILPTASTVYGNTLTPDENGNTVDVDTVDEPQADKWDEI